MTVHSLSIFAISLATWFILGCNSHASFENNNTNNGNCGNLQLDTGEACEHDSQGKDFFANAATCMTQGYDSGSLLCTPACGLDTSACIGAGQCDPIFDLGCDDGTNCFYFPSDNITACNDPGGVMEGDSCSVPSDCDVRMTCFDTGDGNGSLCRRVCQPGNPCPDDLICIDDLNWLNGTLGVCPVSGCNPVTGGGCDTGQSCYFNDNAGNFACDATGTVPSYNQCFGSSECEPGHYCTNISSYDFGYSSCVPLCDLDHPCNNGAPCAFARGSQTGLCLPDEGCDPLNPDSCASPTRACFITDDLGHTACLTPSVGGTGSNCNLFMYCNIGFFCDNAGNETNICRSFCNMGNPNCTDGTCTGQSWPLESVGICK